MWGLRRVDTIALGLIVMLPGVLAALFHDRRLKYGCLAASFLIALAATLGVFR
jgi:hypothetical protein